MGVGDDLHAGISIDEHQVASLTRMHEFANKHLHPSKRIDW